MTCLAISIRALFIRFQYRKRYEVTCDVEVPPTALPDLLFQYRKRYEVTCDEEVFVCEKSDVKGFNTASGMRSHVTRISRLSKV